MMKFSSMMKRQPKGQEPTKITTVDNDKFQVVGEEKLYDCPCDANARARKVGPGTEVIRLSDGKTISVTPTFIPPPPMSD